MKGSEKGRKCGAVDKWITGGLMQGGARKETVKHQFREGKLLRMADVRGNVWAASRLCASEASGNAQSDLSSLGGFLWSDLSAQTI